MDEEIRLSGADHPHVQIPRLGELDAVWARRIVLAVVASLVVGLLGGIAAGLLLGERGLLSPVQWGLVVGGAALLLKGLRFLAQRPKLFWLGAVPPFIMSVVFGALLVLLISRLGAIADAITPFADGWAETARTAMQVLAGAGVLGVTLLVMIISFSTLTMALGAPIYDKISEAVDAELSGELPSTGESWTSWR